MNFNTKHKINLLCTCMLFTYCMRPKLLVTRPGDSCYCSMHVTRVFTKLGNCKSQLLLLQTPWGPQFGV